MDDTIIIIYCLCDDFLKAIGHRDDLQVTMSTAEVMTVPLVAATFLDANVDKTSLFLHEYGYVTKVLGKSRLSRRIYRWFVGLGKRRSSTVERVDFVAELEHIQRGRAPRSWTVRPSHPSPTNHRDSGLREG